MQRWLIWKSSWRRKFSIIMTNIKRSVRCWQLGICGNYTNHLLDSIFSFFQIDILCNDELLGKDHTLKFVWVTRWRYKVISPEFLLWFSWPLMNLSSIHQDPPLKLNYRPKIDFWALRVIIYSVMFISTVMTLFMNYLDQCTLFNIYIAADIICK